jgi:hypothetical protein
MRHPSLIALSHDHHHGLALALRCRKQALGQLKPTGVEGLRIRAQEFREFFDKQLTPHFRAEEEVLFPFMRETAPQSSALLDDLVREHATFRQAVEKLAGGTALSKMIFDLGDLLKSLTDDGWPGCSKRSQKRGAHSLFMFVARARPIRGRARETSTILRRLRALLRPFDSAQDTPCSG